jgi:hypothetical protein
MAKTTTTAKTQGEKAVKKAESLELLTYPGEKEFIISKDFARYKKGDKVVIVFERAKNWKNKGII